MKLYLSSALLLAACNTNDVSEAGESDVGDNGDLILESDFDADQLQLMEIVDCTLEDGTETQCYSLTFVGGDFSMGAVCPDTIDEVGGLTFYDGDTDPGFHMVSRAFFEAMESDGYDIVDDDGNVRIITDFDSSEGAEGHCVELPYDSTVESTFQIPVTPSNLSSPAYPEDTDFIGVSVTGVAINEVPQITTLSQLNGNAAVLDRCGGHADLDGSYHLHLVPEALDLHLESYGYDEIECSRIATEATARIGWARDGYPMYSYADADGSVPTDLDACGGHIGSTADYSDELYHYHASAADPDTLPPCLIGAPSIDDYTAGGVGTGSGGQ
jgi:hypothetical protein